MNKKKMWQRFFSLNRHHAEGFTLVELIVVIAILAILGGVAVPAYSGYVAKAERAADDALLAELNMAFASACALNGESHIGRTDKPTADIGADKEATVTTGAQTINESFKGFYEGGEFKVITELFYDGNIGAFAENSLFTYKGTNGVTYTASAEDIAKYKATTWAKDLSTEQILNMVAGVADSIQGGSTSDEFKQMMGDDKFRAAAAAALGINVADYDTHFAAMKAELVDKYVTEGKTERQAAAAAEKELNSNIAVLVAAKDAQTAGKDIVTILKENGGADATGSIKNTMENTSSTMGLSQAALAYGLYNAYIYSDPNLTDEQKAEQSSAVNALSGGFESAGFQAYLDTAQAQKDLDGLLASLNVVTSQNKDTAQSVVTGGLNSKDVIDAMNSVLGN